MLAEVFLQAALGFLSREVPKWARENHCYSCHNNGDGARALFRARTLEPLTDTIAWLRNPGQWDEIHGAPAASDRKLAQVQFSAALDEAYRDGAIRDVSILRRAAERLAAMQDADGSWRIDTGGLPGAPATYGTALATYLSRRALQDGGGFETGVTKATEWLRKAKPASVVDAAALLLAERGRGDCREFLLKSQTSDGGWGAQPRMPAEAFDTAIVLLALDGPAEVIARGRAALIRMQEKDGGWPETTRPSGMQSYAERISTTAWAVYALLPAR